MACTTKGPTPAAFHFYKFRTNPAAEENSRRDVAERGRRCAEGFCSFLVEVKGSTDYPPSDNGVNSDVMRAIKQESSSAPIRSQARKAQTKPLTFCYSSRLPARPTHSLAHAQSHKQSPNLGPINIK